MAIARAMERSTSSQRGRLFMSITPTSCSGRRSTTRSEQESSSDPSALQAASNAKEQIMIIGVPKEIKDNEARVGVTPAGVKALTEAGHFVLVETQAGAESGFLDAEYQDAGAEIVGEAGYVWGKSEMVVKVKEPIEEEYVFFREGLVLFTYLHLAPVRDLTDKLLESGGIGRSEEHTSELQRTLPLLTPMSEVAGRMSVQVGATYLEKERGGRGILLGGVPGVPPAHVCILGGGIVGANVLT